MKPLLLHNVEKCDNYIILILLQTWLTIKEKHSKMLLHLHWYDKYFTAVIVIQMLYSLAATQKLEKVVVFLNIKFYTIFPKNIYDNIIFHWTIIISQRVRRWNTEMSSVPKREDSYSGSHKSMHKEHEIYNKKSNGLLFSIIFSDQCHPTACSFIYDDLQRIFFLPFVHLSCFSSPALL